MGQEAGGMGVVDHADRNVLLLLNAARVQRHGRRRGRRGRRGRRLKGESGKVELSNEGSRQRAHQEHGSGI